VGFPRRIGAYLPFSPPVSYDLLRAQASRSDLALIAVSEIRQMLASLCRWRSLLTARHLF
jgi:hypothetical protein